MTPTQYRAQRIARHLGQGELAALLGVARETISRREAGEVEITREMELAISALPPPRQKPEGPKA